MNEGILKGIECELEILQNRLADLDPETEDWADVHDLYMDELDRYINIEKLELEKDKENNRKSESELEQYQNLENNENAKMQIDKDYEDKEKNRKLEYFKAICSIGKDTFIVYMLGKVIKQSWENELGKGEILTSTAGKECTRNIFSFALRKFGL